MEGRETIFEPIAPSQGLIKELGSKFYGFAFPVGDISEANGHLQELRKKYFDATHHCYAWRLGAKGENTFIQDDGEPAHTAGSPILGQIRSHHLTNTLVVVVRYFGGTKLGVRGLIDAYKAAAEEVLLPIAKREIIATTSFVIRYSYEQTNLVNKVLHPYKPTVISSAFTEICQQTLSIRDEKAPLLKAALLEAGIILEEIDSQ